MKNLYYLAFACILSGLLACNKESIDNPAASADSGGRLRISVIDTKASFDAVASKTNWASTDKIGVIHEYRYDNGSGITSAKNNSQQQFNVLSASGSSADFESEGDFVWVSPAPGHEPVGYSFYMYFPYNPSTTAKDNVLGELPAIQAYDMAGDWDVSDYDFMYSSAVNVSSRTDAVTFSDIKHVFSIMRLQFNNDTGSDVSITKVKLESESGNMLAGRFKAVISKGRANECVNSAVSAVTSSGYFTAPSAEVETVVSNGTIPAGASGSVRLMINAAPTTIGDNKVKPFLGYNSEITYGTDDNASLYPSDILKVTVTKSDNSTLSARFYGKDIPRGGMAVKTIALSRMNASAAVCEAPVIEYYARRTKSSASFTVTLPSGISSYKYLYQALSDAAPTADYVAANGTAATDAELTVSGLSAASAYRLYVVSTDGSSHSELVSAIFRTVGCPADYYEEGITIGSVTYDRNTEGATLVSSITGGSTFASGGVFFVAPGDYDISAVTNVTSDLVFIGRYDNGSGADTRPAITVSSETDLINVKNNTELIVLENCDFVIARQLINQSNTPSCNNSIIIDNCKISPNATTYKESPIVITGAKGGFATENLFMSNCLVEMFNTKKLSPNKSLVGFSSDSGLATAFPKMKSIRVFGNSIYYSEASGRISSSVIQLPAYKASELDVEVSNNTIYNMLPSTANSNNNGYICIGTFASTAADTGIKSLTLTDNIFYHGNNAGEKTGLTIVQNENLADSYVYSGNIVYNRRVADGTVYDDYANFTIVNPGFSATSGITTFETSAPEAVGKGDPRWWVN